MSPKKKEPKEPKISLKDIESKLLFINELGRKDRFYNGLKWGIFLSLFGNLFVLLFYDYVVKYFLKDQRLIVFILIITAIILFIIFTFLKDKQIKASEEMNKEDTELTDMIEKHNHGK